MGIYQGLALAAVLRTKAEIRYWKERLATEPIERFPLVDGRGRPDQEDDSSTTDGLFEEGNAEWMSKSDLNIVYGQLKTLQVK
jgi:hypothetical protein